MERIYVQGPKMPDRPMDPTLPEVVFPRHFLTSDEVIGFYRRNNKALHWEQVDRLVEIYDTMKAEEAHKPAAVRKKGAHLMQTLTEAWKGACAATQVYSERLRALAASAAVMMGQDGPTDIDYITKVYHSVGTRATNRAIVELCSEDISPKKRFQFLEYRAKAQRDMEGKTNATHSD